jgi:phosphonate transport system ATP-binding protein
VVAVTAAERAMTLAVHIERLDKTFGACRALRGVSLAVQEGEMVALLGASGSGKSTLLRHVCGLHRGDPSSGALRVFGAEVQERGRLARDVRCARRQIGVIFQQFNLVARSTVLVNVLAGLLHRTPRWRSLLQWFRADERRLALGALDQVGIVEHAYKRASQLSGGQQQRAAIARALVQGARLVLADEPIASLDPESARRVMETLAQINRERRTTVIVSLHQVEYALKYCARTVALREGAVVYDGPSAALTPERLRALYGTDAELIGADLEQRPHIPAPAGALVAPAFAQAA